MSDETRILFSSSQIIVLVVVLGFLDVEDESEDEDEGEKPRISRATALA
jgi:hypothetical protein